MWVVLCVFINRKSCTHLSQDVLYNYTCFDIRLFALVKIQTGKFLVNIRSLQQKQRTSSGLEQKCKTVSIWCNTSPPPPPNPFHPNRFNKTTREICHNTSLHYMQPIRNVDDMKLYTHNRPRHSVRSILSYKNNYYTRKRTMYLHDHSTYNQSLRIEELMQTFCVCACVCDLFDIYVCNCPDKEHRATHTS